MKSAESKSDSTKTCVCCGYQTLIRKSSICSVCRWDDDGHDNPIAFRYSASNQTNLNLARFRFLEKALTVQKHPQARYFSIDETGGFIEERTKTGKVIYRGPIPFVDYARHGNAVAAVPLASTRKTKRSA